MNKMVAQHEKDVEKIISTFNQIKETQKLSPSSSLNVRLDKHLSNTTRAAHNKKNSSTLGLEVLNRVLHIDTEKQTALVEPRVAMDQLVQETLSKGLRVPVLPEFKGITVGGAIMGAALESSSHLYGQFNDVCLRYQILLGNGEVIWVSPQENPDLYYGISGSYGSLGVLLAVELQLIPAKEWVSLHYHRFDNIPEAIQCLQALHNRETPPEFLEGLLFSKNHIMIIEGKLITPSESRKIKDRIPLKYPWSPWFYQHIKKRLYEGSAKSEKQEKIFLPEYLFRYDRGAFWIGSYALHIPLFLRYLTEAPLSLSGLSRKFFGTEKLDLFHTPKDPGTIFRSLLGWSMSSRSLYRLLHANGEQWAADRFMIQDFYIPQENVTTFLNHVLSETDITPLWLCPIKPTQEPQLFSPHCIPNNSSSLLINIGVYGIPKIQKSLYALNRLLQQWTTSLKGRKMLYSHSYYTPEEFWKIYPQKEYRALRQRYYAHNIWTSIEDKVLTK